MMKQTKTIGQQLTASQMKALKGSDGGARCMPMAPSCAAATITNCCIPCCTAPVLTAAACNAAKQVACAAIWPLI